MDPFTAVGFAASILTFVDFSHEIISGTLEVLKSGRISENANTDVIIKDLNNVTKELKNCPVGSSGHMQDLKSIATQCQTLSDDLVKLLEKLKTTAGGSKWKAVKVTLHSLWKKGEVAKLESQLCKYRSQILLRLVLILNDRQLAIDVHLKDFQSQSERGSRGLVERLSSFRRDVLDAMENKLRQDLSDGPLNDRNSQLQLINDVRTSLDALLETSKPPSPEIRILKQIYFKSIYSREDSMLTAESKTFEWILDDNDNPEGEEDLDDLDAAPGKREFESRNAYKTAIMRSRARATFLTWLRSGNRVFHLSGKAGSGKSTLMKFLLDHRITREALNQWAGEKQLLFGHFFFWRSGDELQMSLQGLYRSILFEVLKQFPDLIPEVFPEAYSSFVKNSSENSIDEIFFRPNEFRNSFHKLISKSPNPRYRFCFFIDGLDEYGEDGIDRLDHRELAENLEKWAAQDDIKILATSRPHIEFEDTFSNDLRIRLHQLTAYDIFLFSGNMFNRDKNFHRIKDGYLRLVRKVVDYSDGVFLWARLAVRCLLMSLARRDPIDSLERRLDSIPQDFNKLYEQMLASINQVDREKAFKMLLLVARNETMYPINALAFTWLDSLEDPSWPTSCNIRPYTEEEIEERHQATECQLDGLTNGLLELVSEEHQPKFFRKHVQFFHRTIRDFVLQSTHILDFSEKIPNLTGAETYARLFLAELCCVSTEDISVKAVFRWSLPIELCGPKIKTYTYRKPRYTLLCALENLFYHHNRQKSSLCGVRVSLPFCLHLQGSLTLSYLHYVAALAPDQEFVEEKLSRDPDLLRARGDLSLLLSSSVTIPLRRNNVTLVKFLLDMGASPNDRIEVYQPHTQLSATVWMVFCLYMVCQMVEDHYNEMAIRKYCETLEHFFAAGVDTDCSILLLRSNLEKLREGSPTHVTSLRGLLQEAKPPNLETLSKLIDGSRDSLTSNLYSDWRCSTVSPPVRADDYKTFHLDMQLATNPRENGVDHQFYVHSIWWGDIGLGTDIYCRLW